jgi:hypothetical protein
MIRPSGTALPAMGGNVFAAAPSTNWAGYAVQSNRPGAFSSVSASWVMPKANCAGVAGHKFAAFWVGLDGFNSPTVEQTGADSDCNGRTPTYVAWYEGFPQPPVFYRTKVAAGDHMTASVTLRGTSTFVMTIQDITRHWTRTVAKNVPSAVRTSAEVIAEAPSTLVNGQPQVLPLANFGGMRWTASKVNGILLRKWGRRIRITMEDSPTRIKCLTGLVGSADAFTNTFVRSI